MQDLFYLMLAPWLFFVVLAIAACWLLKLAKKRKGIAFAFGVFVQMFSPDPMVEQTIKMVQVDKRVVKQKATQTKGKKIEY
ncbi:hypothetical protein [Colwellia psychrerythraea]|uniref:Uncharacterized protein n=1 Tax=Colwellia psychrerythraea TaxID=28229 RepID=A0A099KW46_COLPS|nr:hypothetical protein [Colwellia psychrerythraea]KGJ94959.1 hypothetical protein GAB14E_2193 [Colwellia psychrerythraea]